MMEPAVAEAIAIGQALPPLVKELTQRKIDVYSGVRPRSIHTDVAWAEAKGFRAPLAQGMMSTAYVSELMTNLLGAGFIQGGNMAVKFIKPVYVDDTLTIHGTVVDKTPEQGATRVTVEVWAENQRGEKTMVGTASGLAS
jgi:3-hydroxybutyryl-CoA dehydratase